MADDTELSVRVDRELSPADRLRVFASARGTCVVCRQHIDGTRDNWIAMPQSDPAANPSDFAPAHVTCCRSPKDGSETTTNDPRLGFPDKKHVLPFGRNSPLKRKITGQIVRRS